MRKILVPQQPHSNAAMWIRPRRAKSLALLPALLLSFFVFVLAAEEAGAEEPSVLPPSQWPLWCATPLDTAPPVRVPPGTTPPGMVPCPPTDGLAAVETSPDETAANKTPLIGSVAPAPGYEPPPGQPVRPNLGVDGGLNPEPTRPHQSPPPDTLFTPSDRHRPATLPTDQPRPKIMPEEALPLPASATNSKPALNASQKEGSAGIRPHSAPDLASDTLSAVKSVPTSTNPPDRSAGEQVLSAAKRTSAADRTTDRTADPMPSQVQETEAASSTESQAAEPLVHEALPNFAAASRDAVYEAVNKTHETVASALEALDSWTAGWLPSGEAAQSSADGTAPEPLEPLIPPIPSPGDGSFFSLAGAGQLGPGGGLPLLLLGVLATVLIMRRQDEAFSWIPDELPKPTSALLLPLERPG